MKLFEQFNISEESIVFCNDKNIWHELFKYLTTLKQSFRSKGHSIEDVTISYDCFEGETGHIVIRVKTDVSQWQMLEIYNNFNIWIGNTIDTNKWGYFTLVINRVELESTTNNVEKNDDTIKRNATDISLNEAYAILHSTCNIKKGDLVRVCRKAVSFELGWELSWTPVMDKFVGRIYEVMSVDKYGIVLQNEEELQYTFPFFILSKIWTQPDEKVLTVTLDEIKEKFGVDKIRIVVNKDEADRDEREIV